VRLWELDTQNRASFDEAALAVDLKKLANATSTQSDFRASKYGTNRGFSPDDVEMQVAAACFGGQGREDEHGWASMTLWVAMTEGDVYALCPFLPSRWRAPGALLASLSTSVIEKNKALGTSSDYTERERRIVDQQCSWLAEVDGQDPILYPGANEFDTVEVYARPDSRLNPVPKLQGPFSITPEPDFGEITDIHVIAAKLDDEALYDDSYVDIDTEDEGLSVGIVCLATSTNIIHVCVDVEGVEAEWLPSKRSRAITFDDTDELNELLLFETIDLARTEANDDGYPTFTPSPADRYELFATHSTGVASLNLRPWIGMLEDELATPGDSGAGFRLNIVIESAKTRVETPVDMETEATTALETAITIFDPALGYVVLTAADHTPFATILDTPSSGYAHPYAPDDLPSTTLALPEPEPRAPYRPAAEFSQPSRLPQLIHQATQQRQLAPGTDMKAPVRFSAETLKVFTEAHRIMSEETYNLGLAAADLFRRCERMRSELQEQVRKVAEVAAKVDAVTGADEPGEEDEGEGEVMAGKERIEHRIEVAREKGVQLNERAERLRRKVGRLRGKDMSAREAAFAQEVERLAKTILPSSDPPTQLENTQADSSSGLASRFDAVKALKETLVQQADESAKDEGDENGDAEGKGDTKTTAVNVGVEYRRQKLRQVMVLLERETALVEAVMGRLLRMQML
jgi:nucleoporin NUP82